MILGIFDSIKQWSRRGDYCAYFFYKLTVRTITYGVLQHYFILNNVPTAYERGPLTLREQS